MSAENPTKAAPLVSRSSAWTGSERATLEAVTQAAPPLGSPQAYTEHLLCVWPCPGGASQPVGSQVMTLICLKDSGHPEEGLVSLWLRKVARKREIPQADLEE